jgi:CcmD family protein
MSTLAVAFIVAWMLTTAYLAFLGRKQWILARRLDELESELAASERGSVKIERAKVA